MNGKNPLRDRYEEINITPAIDDEYPFWISEYGHTFPDSTYHEFTTNTAIFRLEYIISGKGYINTKGYSVIVNPGDTYLLHCGDNHNYYSDAMNPMDKVWINFKGDFAKNIINFFKLDNVVVFRNTDSSEYIKNMHKICKENIDPTVLQSKTMAYFVELAHFLSMQHYDKLSNLDYMDDIRSYLDLHILDNISISELASQISLSPNQTIRNFKKRFGITPHQYIIKNKMRLARTLLRSSTKTIEQISAELNFNNPVHFSRIFCEHIGMRPSKYRKVSVND